MKFDLKTNVALAVLIFIPFLIIGYNIYIYQLNKMDKTQARLEVEQRKNEISAQIKKIQLEMKKYKDNLPAGKDIPWIVSEITSIARQINLDIHNIEPQSTKKRMLHTILPVTLKTTGSYHQLGKFISKLESSKKFIRINKIELQSLSSRFVEKQKMAEPEFGRQTYLFDMQQGLNPAGETLADITFTVSTMYLD